MPQTADRARHSAARRARDADALFVLVREERGSTDLRFIGDFSERAARSLPDVLRQLMRRRPTLIHLDLREVATVDADGVKQLAHAVRICRRHGALVKISASSPVEEAVEMAGAGAALGILPKSLREEVPADGDGASPNGSRGPSPRF